MNGLVRLYPQTWRVATLVLVLAVMLGFVDAGGTDVGLLAGAGPFGGTLVLAGLILARRGVPSGAPLASQPG